MVPEQSDFVYREIINLDVLDSVIDIFLILAANHAKEMGITMLRVPTVGVHKTFVSMIRELIEEAFDGKQPIAEIGTPWICTPECCAIRRRPESQGLERE